MSMGPSGGWLSLKFEAIIDRVGLCDRVGRASRRPNHREPGRQPSRVRPDHDF